MRDREFKNQMALRSSGEVGPAVPKQRANEAHVGLLSARVGPTSRSEGSRDTD